MDPKKAVDWRHTTRSAIHHTRTLYVRAIPYGSYNESLAARILMTIGLGVLAGMALWMLIAVAIL
jgi:hypothetical protein